MVNFVAAWVSTDSVMQGQQLTSAYTPNSNPAFPNGVEPSGMYVQGFDPSLGIGQFVYAQMSNAAGCVLGNVCELTSTTLASGTSVSVVNSVQQWQGAANSGKTLCVALATLAQNQYGWFQVYGAALVTISGAIAAGNPAYWNANGVVQAAAVASKQMLSVQALLAPAASFGQGVQGVTPVIAAGFAVYFVNAPHAQSAIT